MSVAEIVTARVDSQVSVTQAFKTAGPATDEQSSPPTYNPGPTTYNSGSSPPGVFYSGQVLALVAGVATIDLTALAGGLQGTIDGTGKKIQMMRIRGEADGSNAKLTISEGAANPMELFGAANPIEYPAGCRKAFTFEFDDSLDDIGAADCEIDLAGTGTDSFFVEFILG